MTSSTAEEAATATSFSWTPPAIAIVTHGNDRLVGSYCCPLLPSGCYGWDLLRYYYLSFIASWVMGHGMVKYGGRDGMVLPT